MLFILFSLVLIAINARFLRELINFALENASCSHILIIPFISGWLLVRKRHEWVSNSEQATLLRGFVLVAGIALAIFGAFQRGAVLESDYQTLRAFTVVAAWLGGFVFFYGISGFRAALFPLLFLLLMIPIPQGLLRNIVYHLQHGSAEMAAVLFRITGTPFYRDGTMFLLPGVNIDIAPQCSGIRSSMALFITTLLAGYLMLKSAWRRTTLALLAIPMAMFKNSVRIVALSLMGIHVDMRILTNSSLHHDGGVLFFLLALLIMAPVLWILQRGERKQTVSSGQSAENSAQFPSKHEY